MSRKRVHQTSVTALRALYRTAAWIAIAGSAAQAQDVVDGAAEATGEAVLLGTIYINARRVEEELLDAPLAVSVQSGEDFGIDRVDDIADLSNRAPNVTSAEGNGQSFIIRGVGSQSLQGLNTEVGVGLFLDEVYLGRPDAAPQFLFDLEQAEIVRGTQSSIYGRNTIGGAVNLITRRPGEFAGGNAGLTYGTDGLARANLAFDQPLSQDGKWLSRTALSYTHAPDGIRNIATGEDDLALKALNGRFTVTGEIGDSTNLTFSFDVESVDDRSKGGWAPLALAFKHQSDLDFPARRQDDRVGVMLRVDHDFDRFWFQSTTAFRGFDQDLILDGDFTSGPYNPALGAFALQQGRLQKHRQLTQEFRFGSHLRTVENAGDFSWSAGLFFLSESFEGTEFYELASVSRNQVSSNGLTSDARAYSVFGNASYQLSDRLALHGGLRYSYETQKANVAITSPSGTFIYGAAQSGSTRVSSGHWSPEIGLDYQISDNTLAFARVSSGYKSGGVAQFFDATGNVNTYGKETALSYEAGLKTQLWDGRAALDVTLFRTEWSDLQSNVFISDIQRVTANAASAVSQGLEIGLDAQLNDELRLRANYGYLDAKFTDFKYRFFSAAAGGNVTIDYSGNPIPWAPRHSASLTLDWEKKLRNGANLLASGTYTYRNSFTFDPTASYRQSSTHLFDASVSYQQDNWTATLWGKNLTDEDYLKTYFLFGRTDYGIAAKGRRFGITLSSKW
ncbi:MAG: TonB-dependent receptor [Pseudomonadota bacterium]